jgi:predicted transcriptional regulator
VINENVIFNNVKTAEVVASLVSLNFVKMSELPHIKSSKAIEI